MQMFGPKPQTLKKTQTLTLHPNPLYKNPATSNFRRLSKADHGCLRLLDSFALNQLLGSWGIKGLGIRGLGFRALGV